MSQFDWLDHTHARRENPETSKKAARSMKFSAKAICDRILEILKATPATADELAKALGLDGHQVGKRTADLKNAHLIEPSEVTRAGKSGRQQTVWRVKT